MPSSRKKKRRWFCLPSCFSGPDVFGTDELEQPLNATSESFLTQFRSQRRTAPISEITGDGGEKQLAISGDIQRDDVPSVLSPTTNQDNGDELVKKHRKDEKQSKSTVQSLPQTPLSTPAGSCHVSAGKSHSHQRADVLQPVKTEPTRPAHPTRHPTPANRPLGAAAGLAMMVVTLTVLLLFGLLCAVLFNCLWFYVFSYIRQRPSLLPAKDMNGMEVVDMDSPEYKKKVVLTGLLERNRHRASRSLLSPMASPVRRR